MTTPKDELRDPHAEREVLAWVFERERSPAEVKAMLATVPKQAWAFDRHRIMADAMLGLAESGVPVDVLSLRTALVERGHWETCGGVNGLGALLGIAGATENVPRCAKRIVQLDLERQILDEWTGGMVESMQPKPRHVERLGRIAELNAKLVALNEKPESCAQKVAALIDRIHNPDQRVVYRTGLGSLDDRLDGGLSPGDVMVILAAPSTGKTALAGQISAQFMRDGLPVIWFCETSEDKMLMRWLAGESGVPIRAQKRGDLTNGQWGAAVNGADRMSRWKFAVRPLMSVAQMEAEATAFKREHGGLGAVVVDYLQLVDNGVENSVTNIERTTRGIRLMAAKGRLDCVAIELSQPDKASSKSGDLGMSSGKGAGSIEADCDVLVIPLRDDKDDRRAGLRMAKVKDGQRRDVPLGALRFNGARMAFEEA
jgi:replicative DNA helicase